MQPSSRRSLRSLVAPATAPMQRFLADLRCRIPIASLASHTSLDRDLETLRGRSVLILTRSQLATALAVVQLDGIVRRMVLCPPDLSRAHRMSVLVNAEIDAIVGDEGALTDGLGHAADLVVCSERLRPDLGPADQNFETEWVLFTSGTTGHPKLAVHTLASLIAPFGGRVAEGSPVWSTFYDIRRYGGLQILLRALTGGGSMVLSDADEPVSHFAARAGADGVTYISGTPSHWRGLLMSSATNQMSPGYLRLSGEACDQAILDRLRQAYPASDIVHAFASTEAGVGFDVGDGRAGFPAALIGPDHAGVRMRLEDGSLRIRSTRTATRYLGANAPSLLDPAGFVDTGDLLELRGDRYYFIGRRGGIINVGGLKVHPEAVEAVINQHPAVHTSRVSSRSSPITGALVVAEIVMKGPPAPAVFETVRREVLELCRDRLLPHQVPAMLREAPSLEVAASGKLVRRHA